MNEPAPNLKSFYIRRLTRLEPPYLLVLTVLMFMNVFLFHKSELTEQLPHYFASFFYLHNILYQSYPEINFVFWSLEIEIQFYLLAPLLAKLFMFQVNKRRALLLVAILLFATINFYYQPPFISLLNYIHYFLAGFLALDFYLNAPSKKHYAFDGAAFLCLICIWTGFFKYGIPLPFVLAGFIYFSSQSVFINKFISTKWISIIGGMCYSLYMLHYPVMAAFLNRIVGAAPILQQPLLDFSVKLVLTLLVVFSISALFFVVVERPCMRKDWYRSFFNKTKQRSLRS